MYLYNLYPYQYLSTPEYIKKNSYKSEKQEHEPNFLPNFSISEKNRNITKTDI